MNSSSSLVAVVQVLGLLAALFLAYWSFRRRSLSLGDEPTMPEYFTRRRMYWLGIGTYCLIIALIYLSLVNVWMPIAPLLEVVGQRLVEGDAGALIADLDGGLLVPWIALLGFLFLVGFESRFNPLLIIRDAVLDVYAIPRKAVDVYNALRGATLSNVDSETRRDVISYLLADTLEEGDFDKATESIEYKWARASLLYAKIQAYAHDPSFQRFFVEPSLRWGDICLMVNQSSEQLAVWQRTPPHYSKTMQLIQDLNELDRLLCRLLSCLVIFGSPNENEMWQTVMRLGGNPNRLKLKHSYKYLLTFVAALAAGVVAGREVSVLLHNQFVPGAPPLRHFSFDTMRWILYGLFIYVMPLGIVFGSRIVADRTVTAEPERRYYGFYTVMLIVGFVVSTSMSALVLGLAGTIDTSAGFDFLASFRFANRWGILPALLCGYAAYQMDTAVDDSESKFTMLAKAALRFAVWALLALIIMLYATDGLSGDATSLRFTVVVTTVFVAGALGAVTRFKTISADYADALQSRQA